MPHPSQFSQFYHPNDIWRGVMFKLLVMYFLHSPVTSVLLRPYIPLSTLLSNTLSLRSSLNVSDQFSHPYTTTGKFIFL